MQVNNLINGNKLTKQGKYAEAIEFYNKAIKFNPNCYLGYYARAYACDMLAKQDEITGKVLTLNGI